MTNELATTDTAVPVRSGLVPETMAEALQLAQLMARAKLVPQPLQGSPGDCLMVVHQAGRWQMDPFAVAQECCVIQGKLMHSGKLVAAVVNARGNLTRRLSYDYRGLGDDRTITVSGQLRDEAEPRTVDVVLRNAKTTNAMWLKQPDQQLMYHGARVWARRHTPELMLGVYSPEEFDEPTPRPQPVANVSLPDRTPTADELLNPPDLHQEAHMAAEYGRETFARFWKRLTPVQRGTFGDDELASLKQVVEQAYENIAETGLR